MGINRVAVFFAVLGIFGTAHASEIASVRVEGLNRVPEASVLEAVSSRVGEEAEEKKLARDIKSIFSLGVFTHVGLRLDPREKDSCDVVFEVAEHPVIEAVRFEGAAGYSASDLAGMLNIKPGEVFNDAVFKEDVKRLTSKFYADGGGVFIKGTRLEGDSTLVITCARPVFGEICVEGNAHVKEHVIRRYLSFKPGDEYNRAAVEMSAARLRSSGLFSDILPEAVPNGEVIDVLLKVVERKSAAVTVNAGWGTDIGIAGGIGFKEENLGGNGQRFEVSLGLTEEGENAYSLTLGDPYMSAGTLAWQTGLYARTDDNLTYSRAGREVFAYEEEAYGAYASVEGMLGNSPLRRWNLRADRRSSDADYIPSSVGSYSADETLRWFDVVTGGEPDSEVFSLSLSLAGSSPRAESRYPEGTRFSAGIEKAFEVLGGDTDFTKYRVEAVRYAPIFDIGAGKAGKLPVTAALRARAGWSGGFLPITERYSVGGGTSLRGYDNGDFRGSEMFLANAELRVPISDSFSVVGFYDVGNAWDCGHMDFSELESSWGTGIRFSTPMGTVRVDAAWGGSETKWHLALGEMF